MGPPGVLTRTRLLGWFTRKEAISAVDRELGRPGTALVLLSSKTDSVTVVRKLLRLLGLPLSTHEVSA